MFNGADYQPERDELRLTKQHQLIFFYMCDGKWRTLADIANETHQPEASISAQLRHLRKVRFGSHRVNKRYIANGLYEYQLEVNNATL